MLASLAVRTRADAQLGHAGYIVLSKARRIGLPCPSVTPLRLSTNQDERRSAPQDRAVFGTIIFKGFDARKLIDWSPPNGHGQGRQRREFSNPIGTYWRGFSVGFVMDDIGVPNVHDSRHRGIQITVPHRAS